MKNDEFIVFVHLPDDHCLPLKANKKLFIRLQIHRSRPPARDLSSSIVVVIIVTLLFIVVFINGITSRWGRSLVSLGV